MKLPLDPSHLDAPASVVVAVYTSVATLAAAAWQWAGKLLAQLPLVTPDKVVGWQERDVYLCAAILFASCIAVIAKWIAGTLLRCLAENTNAGHAQAASNTEVAKAINNLTDRVDGVVMSTMQHAMQEAFSTPPTQPLPPALGSGKKRAGNLPRAEE